MKYYFALLFPTRFYTEGIPGTILDAYAAGIPVICSRWESCADVVDDGVTGITYPFEDMQMLKHTKTLGIIQIDETVWKRLTDEEKIEIDQICNEKLETYYKRIKK